MGIVPVAPNRRRILFEGEKRVNGFIDKFMVVGFKRIEIAKKKLFTIMIDLMT